tara:strand:+ start:89 stop:610 length:522 start_codon:yes stop_codon:yes gene_type:complete
MDHLPPPEIVPLGTTTRTRSDLDAYIEQISPHFDALSYDVLDNNCNHMSERIALFLVGSRLPARVGDCPGRMMSASQKKVLRGVLERLKAQVHAGREQTADAPHCTTWAPQTPPSLEGWLSEWRAQLHAWALGLPAATVSSLRHCGFFLAGALAAKFEGIWLGLNLLHLVEVR